MRSFHLIFHPPTSDTLFLCARKLFLLQKSGGFNVVMGFLPRKKAGALFDAMVERV
jgi:hypothetical protein